MFVAPLPLQRAFAVARLAFLAAVAAAAAAGCSGKGVAPLPALTQAGASTPGRPAFGPYRRSIGTLQTIPGHLSPETLHAPLVGRLPSRQRLRLAIGLPLRNRAEAKALLESFAATGVRAKRRYLSASEFASKFSPSEADYRGVLAFAQASGFRITQTYANRVVIDVDASVADIEKALHVTLENRRRPDGSVFFAPDKEPSVDTATPILHVAGLDNQYVPKPTIASLRPIARGIRVKPNAGSGPGGTFAGSDFRNAYATLAPQNGSGQCIGLFELDSSFFPSDISSYQSEFGLPQLAPQPILLDGYNGQPQIGSGEEETALDIEVAQAMAPGISNIFVYEGTLPDDIFAAMTAPDQRCSQLSASWNFGVDATSQELVDEMALQGQSFFVSSGDGGGFTKDTHDDRDLPNTTVVGGTNLTLNADFRWSSETAWSGSGGGAEKSAYKPPFQHGLKIVRGGTPRGRLVPDVAMVASNTFLIADEGQHLSASGTSISAPLWAAYTSLINQEALSVGQPVLGFADPSLYAIARNSALYASNFHDIVSGSNGPFNALPAYDLVTGWGSPQPGLIGALNPSPSMNFTQLQIVVFTGSDDLRADSDLQASFSGVGHLSPFCLMRSNNGKPSGICTGNVYGDVNGLQGWPSWSTQTLTYTNRFANWTWGGSGTMTLTLTSHNHDLETNDNWDVQAMSVTLSNPSTSSSVTLFDEGDFNSPHVAGSCYWRFQPTGSPPTVKQTFKLLPGNTPSDGCPND